MKRLIVQISLSLCFGFMGAWLFYLMQPKVQEEGWARLALETGQGAGAEPIHLSDEYTQALNERLADLSFVEASRIGTDRVVYIRTLIAGRGERYSWFDLFFGYPSGSRQSVGSGSGVIFSADGYIVTNNHVIDGATQIEVVHKRRTYEARLIGTDPSTDLALLKIEAQNLPFFEVASSRKVRVGDWVVAVGNPFNLTSTVTAGIVSAKGRRINILEDIFPIESFIQTDAAINPGNSGGALVNLQGKLVGINTAILSKTGSYAGYGFAVPSDIMLKVVEDLKNYGEVQKVFIGADVADIDDRAVRQLEIDALQGAVVAALLKGGTAEAAGLKLGDVIVRLDNSPIETKADFDEMLSYFNPGDRVQVTYMRGKKTQQTQMVLLNIDGTTDILSRKPYEAKAIGAVLETVPKMERVKLGVENGVRVRKVERGIVSQMNIPEGFIFITINRYPIETPEELEEILTRLSGRIVIEGIERDGKRKLYYSRL